MDSHPVICNLERTAFQGAAQEVSERLRCGLMQITVVPAQNTS